MLYFIFLKNRKWFFLFCVMGFEVTFIIEIKISSKWKSASKNTSDNICGAPLITHSDCILKKWSSIKGVVLTKTKRITSSLYMFSMCCEQRLHHPFVIRIKFYFKLPIICLSGTEYQTKIKYLPLSGRETGWGSNTI